MLVFEFSRDLQHFFPFLSSPSPSPSPSLSSLSHTHTHLSAQALRIFIKRIEEFSSMPERTQQGWIDNQIFLRLLRHSKNNIGMSHDLQLTNIHGDYLFNENTTISYYGNSQGSVIGGGYFSSSLDLQRGVLGVPGCPFALLLSRSKDFAPYHAAMKFQIWDSIDVRLYLSLMQQLWDNAESGGWLTNLVRPSSKYPNKAVLLQAALGDAQVTTLGAEFMARTLEASTIEPETRRVYGVPERRAPWKVGTADGTIEKHGGNNGFVEWKYDDAPPVPHDRDLPPTDGMDTHECPRREPKAQEQLAYFLINNEIVQTCPKGHVCESKKCPDGRSNN